MSRYKFRRFALSPTYHNSSAFWVDSQELPGDNAPAATLPKRFLVDLLKHVFGWMVFQDDNATAVTSNNDVVYKRVKMFTYRIEGRTSRESTEYCL